MIIKLPSLPLSKVASAEMPSVEFLNSSRFKVVAGLKGNRIVMLIAVLLVFLIIVAACFEGYRIYSSPHRLTTSKVPLSAAGNSSTQHTMANTQPKQSTDTTSPSPPAPVKTSSNNSVASNTPISTIPPSTVPQTPKIDASSPAAIGIPGSTCTQPVQNVQTPAFSPPANSRIYIVASADSYPIGDANCLNETAQNSIASITSTAGISWSRLASTMQRDNSVGGFVDVWSAVLPASQTNMRITVNFAVPMKAEPNQVSPSGMLNVIVVDNAGANQTVVPVTGDQVGSMTSSVSETVSSVPANSLVFLAVDYWNSYSTPPAVPGGQAIVGNVNNQGENDTWTVSDATALATSGPVTLTQTITDTNDTTDNWHAVAWAVTP